eukprot:GEMP01012904.1.p1 GENE.GEMP01012904.1~~GEMP01012904.1.p1  ORF type:complete len:493 (+),score=130.30 GEMP01012904.1:177-1655(+)
MALSLVKSAERGDYEGFWRLLCHNPFIGEREKEQALWVSIRKQNPEFTRMLLEAKCDPNVQMKGETPLQYIARQVETEDNGQITFDLRSFGGHTGICVASPLRVHKPQHVSAHTDDSLSPRQAATWDDGPPLHPHRTLPSRARATWVDGATTRPRAMTPPARHKDWAGTSMESMRNEQRGAHLGSGSGSVGGGASRRDYRAAVASSMKRRVDRLASDSPDPWAYDSDSQPSQSPALRTRSFGEYYPAHGGTGGGGGRHAGYAVYGAHHAGYDSRPQMYRPEGSRELTMLPQPNSAPSGHSGHYAGCYGDTTGHRSDRVPSSPRMARSPKTRSPTKACSPNGVSPGVGFGMTSGSSGGGATEARGGTPFGQATSCRSMNCSRVKQSMAQEVGLWRNAAGNATTPDWLEEGLREERNLERNLMEVRKRIFERTRMALANQRTQHQDECVVCQDSERTVLFLPCSHLCTCPTCAAALLDCPLCRAQIQDKLCVYK